MKKHLCSRCQKYKSENQFQRMVIDDTPVLGDKYDKSTVSALGKIGNRQWVCRECSVKYSSEWKKENKEKVRENSKRYYEKNKEELNAKSKKWGKENKERVSARNKEHRQKMKALRDAGNARGLEWWEKQKEIARHYKENNKNKEKGKTNQKTYYDKMKALRDAGDAKGLEWWDKQLELSSQYRKRKQLETVNVKIEKLQAELKILKTKKAELRK